MTASLITYIKAIHHQQTSVSISGRESYTRHYTDGEAEITTIEEVFRFNNGVVIRYAIEQDNVPSGPEVMCEECWISYEVADAGALEIRPVRKVFSHRCQESFWLKIQAGS